MKPVAERMYDSCTSKTRYFTHKRAELVARALRHKENVQLRVYRCDFCHSYHLTSKV